jgi:uncharacterized protein (DUF302 family)
MKLILTCLLAFTSLTVHAASPAIYERSFDRNMETAYQSVYDALENSGFRVVYEVNLHENLALLAEKNIVKNFNTNHLEATKSMVFCSGTYAVKISNADPSMLALCPLHLTLIQKAGRVSVLFVRPGFIAQGSKAETTAKELEDKIIMVLENALSVAAK